jgi:thiol-disulfide isomerase/thioredoxin
MLVDDDDDGDDDDEDRMSVKISSSPAAVARLAPEIDGGLAWLNVDRPVTLASLRGAVVILDFWTYCCINCVHVLATLRALEERRKNDPVVVIGVHSGKFSTEQDPARIHEAIGRYDVRHPVVVDENMAIWGRYGVRSWPTLVIVRPNGTIAAIAPGEPDLAMLDGLIDKELASAQQSGGVRAPAPTLLERAPLSQGALHYPGKAIALPDGRIALSDSGHHRILVCAPDGEVLASFGSGLRGLRDGEALDAAFNDPQGLCFRDGVLFVADAGNHAIRRVDLAARLVSTVAGTGDLGTSAPQGRAIAKRTALRSPWDLATVGDVVFVAMAGSHQIFRFFPGDGTIELYAGTGVEALLDGPVARSAWAQPSGLSERDGTLYVADSETSAVRAVDLATGTVTTLVGEGLFDFGDDEGLAEGAMLQHALGVAAVPEGVLIADTYNDKIKLLTLGPAGHELKTVLSGLREPGSIAVAPDGAWIIADTNRHRVARVEAGALRPIPIRGAPTPRFGSILPERAQTAPSWPVEGWFATLLELPLDAGIAPGERIISLVLDAARGTELAAGAPIAVSLEVSRRSDLLSVTTERIVIDANGGPRQRVNVPVRVTALPATVIEAEIVASIGYLLCDARDHTSCTPGRLQARIPVRLLAEGGEARIELCLPLPTIAR